MDQNSEEVHNLQSPDEKKFGASILIGADILCLPYAGFLFRHFPCQHQPFTKSVTLFYKVLTYIVKALNCRTSWPDQTRPNQTKPERYHITTQAAGW